MLMIYRFRRVVTMKFLIVLSCLSVLVLPMLLSSVVTLTRAADMRFDELFLRDCESEDAEKVAAFERIHCESGDQFSRTALHRAAGSRDLKLLKQLIDQGADVNATDNNGRSALLEAAGSLEPQAVKVLL